MATTAGGTAKTSEKDADGLRVDVQSLSKERAKLSETRRELERKMENLELLKRKVEDQERDTAEQLRSVRRQEEEVRLNLLPVGNRLKDVCSDVEVENAQRLLDKLLPDVWEKILDHLDENDLFPLALSCRYFRQKQKELVARTGQNGPESRESRLALKTNLLRKLAFCHQSKPSLDLRRFKESQPASAEYLRFCSKEKVSKDNILRAHPEDVVLEKALSVRCLAAFHGHLPLLQELLRSDNTLDPKNLVAGNAVKGGQLETLKWLITQNGIHLCWRLFAKACESGYMEIIRWLRREGCPLSVGACYCAAGNGHLEILKWLRSEGCP